MARNNAGEPPAAGPVIAGVDTHKDAHVLCLLDSLGRRLSSASFPADADGYDALARAIGDPGDCMVVGVEGTASYGAGLARRLAELGYNVVEVLRPKRDRLMVGADKNDPEDAERAARKAASGDGCSVPKAQDGWVEAMHDHSVPEWYIESLSKIGYLFPKAHAVAYVMMAFRIAWFKVHRPLAFYATYFTVRAKAFDAQECCFPNAEEGAERTKRRIHEIENNKDATAVEQDLMTTLEVCYEFYLRGFHFENIDIFRSDATRFLITENGLLPPLTSVRGLGEAAAQDTVEKRAGKEFISIEEFAMTCNKLSKTHIEQLRALGAFAGMSETSQISLF